jgi:hypothetical protein
MDLKTSEVNLDDELGYASIFFYIYLPTAIGLMPGGSVYIK